MEHDDLVKRRKGERKVKKGEEREREKKKREKDPVTTRVR